MLRWITPRAARPESEAERLQEIELIISRFRWFAFVVALLWVIVETETNRVLSWSIVAFFLFSCIVASIAVQRRLTLLQVRLVGGIVLIADSAIILLGMITDADSVERGVGLALVLLIFEAGVRWDIAGGIIGAVCASTAIYLWMRYREAENAVSFEWSVMGYRTALLLIVGLAVGILVRALDTARYALRGQLRDVEVVNRFAVEAPRTGEDEAVRLLAQLLNRELGFERVAVMFHEPNEGVLRPVATSGYPPGFEEEPLPGELIRSGLPITEHRGLAVRSFRDGVPQIVPDVFADPDSVVVDPAIRSELAVPLRAGTRRFGVLVVGATKPDAFDVADARILETLAGELAQVLENARLGEVQRRTIDDLQRLSAMKDDFIAVTSHELRTPLTALRGFARALEDKRMELSDEQVDNAVHAIARQVNRLNSLVEDLLAASLIDSGRSLPSVEGVDVGALAREAVVEVDPGGGRFTFRVEVADDVPLGCADPTFLRRVIVNLLANAVRYSPDGGSVELWASRRGDMVRVEVCDQGVGIDPEDLPRLFGKFVRLRADHSRGGTGLGLYIVKGLVEAMGGEVGVQSVPGQGSCFSFTVPSVPDETGSAGRPAVSGGR